MSRSTSMSYARTSVSVNGVALEPDLQRISVWLDSAEAPYIDAGVHYTSPQAVETLDVRVRVLTDLYPDHRNLAEFTLGNRTEQYVFQHGNRWSRFQLAVGILTAFVAILLSSTASSDVILSAENLNVALKQMQRIKLRLAEAPGTRPVDAIFALGEEASALAVLMSKEVAAHGQQQQSMLDLALERTSALGVDIAWSREHRRFFYDGAAYRRYLELAPHGAHAAASSFWIVRYDFYHSAADDRASLLMEAAHKQAFLRRFPDFKDVAEVGLFLGIDYRDLWRHCRDHKAEDCGGRYRDLTRRQFRHVATAHEGTDAGEIAARMLQRFEAELAETTVEPQSTDKQPP